MWGYSLSRLVQFVVVSLALAVVWMGRSDARSWLQNPEFLIKGWGPPIWQGQKHRGSKSSKSTRARDREVERELERELHRMPPLPATGKVDAGANDAEQVWPQVLPAVEVAVQTRTSALRTDREAERELQRELRRMPQPPPMLPEALACAERLAKIAHYAPLPSRVGPGQCGADNLVQLDSVVMPDQTKVAFHPPPTIGCGMAEEVAKWVREDLGPAASELGAPLASIAGNNSYDCRGRNNVAGAKLSEHSKGNALDITGIKLRNGGVFNLTDRSVAKPFRERMRVAACDRFTTVLGPGSDSHHEEHIHIDLAERSHRYRLCQWDIREPGVAAKPPLPRFSPKEAAKAHAQPGPASRARDANARALPRAKMKTAPNQARRRHRWID